MPAPILTVGFDPPDAAGRAARRRPTFPLVNHIPSVNCFPELWADYLAAVAGWAAALPN